MWEARATVAVNNKIVLSPYARALGIEVADFEDRIPVMKVSFGGSVEGRPQYFHGGATSGLLETAAYTALRLRLDEEGRHPVFKPINITVQFLSGGRSEPAFAKARITRLGARNANVSVEAWQSDRDRPIASAVMNILLVEESDQRD
ncbi:PaaI family thioesterase [Erythrobacteraceae bacterium E2-1 Yellow Sea]|nr:PaaI family thioesterase [Erythrobacteraceae bacterium E2-1 Yellow Sea]